MGQAASFCLKFRIFESEGGAVFQSLQRSHNFNEELEQVGTEYTCDTDSNYETHLTTFSYLWGNKGEQDVNMTL